MLLAYEGVTLRLPEGPSGSVRAVCKSGALQLHFSGSGVIHIGGCVRYASASAARTTPAHNARVTPPALPPPQRLPPPPP